MLAEERILAAVDHPFLANLYGTIQTDTHLHFLMKFCGGGASADTSRQSYIYCYPLICTYIYRWTCTCTSS